MSHTDKTEKPTPKRLADARRKGQVARSADLGGSLVLMASVLALSALGPGLTGALEAQMRSVLSRVSSPAEATSVAGLQSLMAEAAHTLLLTVGPIAGVCAVAGIVVNLGQVGLRPSPQALKPDWRRVDPWSGLRRLLSPSLLFDAGKSVAKVAIVGVIAALAVAPRVREAGGQIGLPPSALGALVGSSVLGIAQRVAGAYLLIGVVDLWWQRRRLGRSLRMSKQEVKDEMRSQMLPAEVRGAIRRRQIQAARARMMAAVPEADVVVTNPTHYAVALRYDGSRPAPEVVAKGQDLVAAQIRRLAEEHGVPVVPDPPLARALHAGVEVGHQIPEELYQAVAQLLAFVYRVAGRRRVAS